MENSKKFFNERAITLATFIGGPIAAGYILKKNYEVLNQKDHAKCSLLLSILFTFIILLIPYFMPEDIDVKIPKHIYILIYTTIIYFIFKIFQGKIIKEHEEAGGEFESYWKAAGIGGISLLITFSFVFLFIYAVGDHQYLFSEFDHNEYSNKIEEFHANENKALELLELDPSLSNMTIRTKLEKGTDLWIENKVILNYISSMEDLPEDILKQNEILLEYCDLRIEYNSVLIKMLSDTSYNGESEITRIENEIINSIERLKTLNN